MGVLSFIGHRLLGFGLLFLGFIFVLAASFAMMDANAFAHYFLWFLALVSVLAGAYFLKTQH